MLTKRYTAVGMIEASLQMLIFCDVIICCLLHFEKLEENTH
jgi:hypothetical protein